MVDDLKKQMRRFESLIGFKGKLDVTSRKSMKELIEALSSKYKNDVYNSLRLHRLESFYDLVESQRKKKEKQEKASVMIKKQKPPRESAESEPTDEDQQQIKDKNEVEQKSSDEVVKIRAEDIDDWKDLMTLWRIYYVMEYPRSEGLTWKRRIAKKKNVDKFEDMDLIEWRVSQNFRLRGLEEWAQRRHTVNLLAEKFGHDIKNTDENNVDSKEMEELLQMFDPSDRPRRKKSADFKDKSRKKPLKFSDESMEDWTESYSEDSEPSDIEDFTWETEDFSDETDVDVEASDLKKKTSIPVCEEDYILELLPVHPEFSRYKEPIFKEMDEAKTFEDWYKLYKKAISQFEEQKSKQVVTFDEKLDIITEEEEGILCDEKFETEPVEEEEAILCDEKFETEPVEEEEAILCDEKFETEPVEKEQKSFQEFNNVEEKETKQDAEIQDKEQIVEESKITMESKDNLGDENVIGKTKQIKFSNGKLDEVTKESEEDIEEKGSKQNAEIENEEQIVEEPTVMMESNENQNDEKVIDDTEKTIFRNGKSDEVTKENEEESEKIKEQAPVIEYEDSGEEVFNEVGKTGPSNAELNEVTEEGENKTESQETEKEYVVDDEEK